MAYIRGGENSAAVDHNLRTGEGGMKGGIYCIHTEKESEIQRDRQTR